MPQHVILQCLRCIVNSLTAILQPRSIKPRWILNPQISFSEESNQDRNYHTCSKSTFFSHQPHSWTQLTPALQRLFSQRRRNCSTARWRWRGVGRNEGKMWHYWTERHRVYTETAEEQQLAFMHGGKDGPSSVTAHQQSHTLTDREAEWTGLVQQVSQARPQHRWWGWGGSRQSVSLLAVCGGRACWVANGYQISDPSWEQNVCFTHNRQHCSCRKPPGWCRSWFMWLPLF